MRARHLALLLLVATVFLIPVPASAHGKIVDSEPAAGARVDTSPEEITVWISETVSPAVSRISLQTLTGEAIDLPDQTVSEDGGLGVITARLPELPDGSYSAEWTVLSMSDGHITRGLVVFGVGDGTVGAFEFAEESIPWIEAAARWAALFSTMAIIGTVAIGSLLEIDRNRIARRWISIAGVLGAAAGLVLLAGQSIQASSGLPVSVTATAFDLVVGTSWGRWILVRIIVSLAVAYVATRPARMRPALISGAVALVIAHAGGSHAAGVIDKSDIAVVAHAIHVAAAGVWVGGLSTMFVLWRRGTPVPWRRFGNVAAVATGLLFATGLFATGLQVDSLDAAYKSNYGWTLAVKIALAGAVGACGLLNATVVHPRFRRIVTGVTGRRIPWGRFRALVALEVAAGVAVVAATGLLTSLSPANASDYGAVEPVDAMSAVIDDIVITLTAQPNRPGDNVLVVHAASSIRPAPDIDRVLIRFARPIDGIDRTTFEMQQVDPTRFRLGGSQLARPGPWEIEVVVRRRGLEDVEASFDWMVGSSTSDEPVLSEKPLAPLTGAIAIGVMVIVIAGLAVEALRMARPGPEAAGEREPNHDREAVGT